MPWLIVIILAYFFFAIVALGDKYLLTGPPNPKSYVFYVGILGILALVLIPFVGFSVPNLYQILLCLLAGSIFIFSLLGLFGALEKFEASRVVPAIGGISPLFVFGLTYFFSGGEKSLGLWELTAFLCLLLGSVLITIEQAKKISFESFKISAVAAFLFALLFVLSKYIYLIMPFWTGFIWIRIGAFLAALFFVFTKEVKREISSGKLTFNKKTGALFLSIQAIGAMAFILQNWAIALADFLYLSIISALQGLQYAFLFIFVIFLSFKFPNILKEEFSKKVIFQKITAILFIGSGLAILAL